MSKKPSHRYIVRIINNKIYKYFIIKSSYKVLNSRASNPDHDSLVNVIIRKALNPFVFRYLSKTPRIQLINEIYLSTTNFTTNKL